MVFSSYVFLFLFLPTLSILYYITPKSKRNIRNGILLFFSIVFYGWSGAGYLILLFLSIFINWMGGILIHRLHRSDRPRWKKIVLSITLICNCLLLGVFKYSDFVLWNAGLFLGRSFPLANIVLPVGISFYTFQGMSYSIDVYRKPELYIENPLKVALYITLFPQLVAGPIVRFSDVVNDIHSRNESLEDVASGLQRFVFGLAKKIILADTFGIIADKAFDGSSISTAMAWIGALAYTMQIYYDFSGYSDMAIGLGRMFGFHFCENFNYPYISASVTEFWRRWHISLSSWFRDYVYIPLGGSRCSKARQLFNLAVVWSLTGLWHGASWNYVFWGIYYLICLVIEKYVLGSRIEKIPMVLRRSITLLIVIFGWVLFRIESMSGVLIYIKTMFGMGTVGSGRGDLITNLVNYRAFWILGAVGITPLMKNLAVTLEARFDNSILYWVLRYICVFVLFLLCIVYILASSYNAFIYFQF